MRAFRFFLPVILIATLLIGLWGGFYLANNLGSKNIEFIIPSSANNKLTRIVNYIDENYVDTVAKDRLIDKAIRTILEELDPHSYYISKEDFKSVNEPLEGNFEGIGIEFVIQKDTLNIVRTIAGGPSEKAGLQAGDQILCVDGDTIAGIDLKNSDVVSLLRGTKGSEVEVLIKRKGSKNFKAKITRDEIPIKSIDVALMLNDTTGYLKISRFAKTTHEEFREAIDSLKSKNRNLDHLVIDLRNNGGGYLGAAINICDDLLEKDKLIVYTQGKSKRDNKKYFSKESGRYKDLNLSVLINEFSASASEIVAGAIQDHDRGTIVGRRSFGKGLVQEQLSLSDASALRLTVARYYTPTGRCIQKPYGKEVDYDQDYYDRVERGELFYRDSIQVSDSLKFTTPKGKIVYGGGGIIPDVFVPIDTLGQSNLLSSLLYVGNLNSLGFTYANSKRQELEAMGLNRFVEEFVIPQDILDSMLKEISVKMSVYQKLSPVQKDEINMRFKSIVARHIWNNKGFYRSGLEKDEMLQKLGLRPTT